MVAITRCFARLTIALIALMQLPADVRADDYVFRKKVPKVIVQGATGANCDATAWATVASGTADLAGGALTLTGPAATPGMGCTPTYFAISVDRPAERLERQGTTVLSEERVQLPGFAPAPAVPFEVALPYVIVVKFHILNVGPMTPTDEEITKNRIAVYIANAEAIFSSMGVGVLIAANQHIDKQLDATTVQAAIDLIPGVAEGWGDPALLFARLDALSTDAYADGQINVYVFDHEQLTVPPAGPATEVNTYRAFFVPQASATAGNDYIVINQKAANYQSFAHEIAHALSIDHVNFVNQDNQVRCYAYQAVDGICDYTPDNLMWVGGFADRSYLTPPQVLRMVFNNWSFINRTERMGRKPKTTIDCPDSKSSHECPFLGALQQ